MISPLIEEPKPAAPIDPPFVVEMPCGRCGLKHLCNLTPSAKYEGTCPGCSQVNRYRRAPGGAFSVDLR